MRRSKRIRFNTAFSERGATASTLFISLDQIFLVKSFLIFFFVLAGFAVRAQQVDSIYFNLYTDSLKKQVHNYINIDGKYSNGSWLPLTAKDVTLTASEGRFEGNSLILDSGCTAKKIIVKAVLKSNPAIWKEVTIYVKTTESTERLKTINEVLQPSGPKKKKNFYETI